MQNVHDAYRSDGPPAFVGVQGITTHLNDFDCKRPIDLRGPCSQLSSVYYCMHVRDSEPPIPNPTNPGNLGEGPLLIVVKISSVPL